MIYVTILGYLVACRVNTEAPILDEQPALASDKFDTGDTRTGKIVGQPQGTQAPIFRYNARVLFESPVFW